jgi:hypothetical protein
MAISKNNFSFKSFEDLDKLAKSYKTTVANVLVSDTKPSFEIADISKEELDNITTFLVNTVIKDSKLISDTENNYSIEFSNYLSKYFGDGMSTKDIIGLKQFVNSYNRYAANNFYENLFSHIFGIGSEINAEGLFTRIVNEIKGHFKNIINGYISKNFENKTIRKTAAGWYSLTDTETIDWSFDNDPEDEETVYDSRTFTVEEFYNSFILKGRAIETIVLLQIISYFGSSVIQPQYDSEDEIFELVTSDLNTLFEESFYVQPDVGIQKEFTFNGLAALSEERSFTTQVSLNENNQPILNKRTLYSLKIEGINTEGNPTTIMMIPMVLKEITGLESVINNPANKDFETIVEIYNILPVLTDSNSTNKLDVGDTITFESIYISLFNNLTKFLDNIDYKNIPLLNSVSYTESMNYFLKDGTSINLFNNLYEDIFKVSEVFYTKDFIQESISVSSEDAKIKASDIEITYTQSGEQITFIDVKGIEFIGAELTEARNLFDSSLAPAVIEDGQIVTAAKKLTYTILYKELNPTLREELLWDPQDFVMARIILQNLKEEIFQANRLGVSFSLDINDVFRNYIERDRLFLLDQSFFRYRYFYGNIAEARRANESDIIGYYIGDSTENSDFLNNYGQFEFQRNEIANFLDIYKVTRDYYYKVLLNKSFIAEDEYKLYEKLFISFFAIERFLNSKIDNIRNIDFFNSRDIFNFLESYGLGVLNSFNFFLNSKDYKLNIIRYFNELVRLKGSKDVISILLKIFDIQDTDIDIKKFFLLDNVEKGSPTEISFKIERIFESSTNKFKISKLVAGDYVTTGLTAQAFGVNKTFETILSDSALLPAEYDNLSININESTSIDPREYVIDYFSKSPKLILINDPELGLYLTYEEKEVLSDRKFIVNSNTILRDAVIGLGIISSSDTVLFYSNEAYSTSVNISTAKVIDYLVLGSNTSVEKTLYILFPNKTLLLTALIDTNIKSSKLNFVEVPYFSDNGSREIISALNSNFGQEYEEFLEDDVYWDTEVVPEELVKEIGINVAETKYLSLTLTENVYKNYFLSRYMISAIDYLYDKLVVNEFGSKSVIMNNLLLDSGDTLFGSVTVSEYFDVIRILFKAVLKLYDAEIDFNTTEPTGGKFYGINKSITESDWTTITNIISANIPTAFSSLSSEFLETQKRIGDTTPITYKKFGILKSDSGQNRWIKYDADLNIENLRIQIPESLNTIPDYLRNSAFANFKTLQNRFKEQQNSGDYVNQMIENLNFFRIVSGNNLLTPAFNNGKDLWLYILSRENLTVRTQEAITKTFARENLYFTVLENMIRFPIDFIEGLMSPYYLPDINHNSFFNNLSETIFDKVFTTTEDPLSVDYNLTDNLAPSSIRSFVEESLEVILEEEGAIPEVGTDAFKNKLQKISEQLIATLDGLRTQFSSEPFMQFAFSLKANEAETLNFVKTATEIFLSYTTTLYKTEFRRIYRTVSESFPFADKANHTLTSTKVDQMSFDEELKIEKL